MSWIIGIFTFILVIDCLLMILLILVQLPKKEAGMGTAFGAGATDALFGAGTGNALTKLTKYVAVVFFVLTLGLSILNAHQSKSKQSKLEQEVNALQQQPTAPVTPPVGDTNLPAPPQPGTPPSTNTTTVPTNLLNITLPPAAPSTPAPATTPAPSTPAPAAPNPGSGTPPAAPNLGAPSTPPPAPAPAPGDSPQPPKP